MFKVHNHSSDSDRQGKMKQEKVILKSKKELRDNQKQIEESYKP